MKSVNLSLQLIKFHIILITVLNISFQSQSQYSRNVVDSLKRVLEKHPEKDSIRVDILASLSVALKTTEVYQPNGYLHEALEITQKIKNSNQEAGIRIMLGFAEMQTGESVKSIENFQAILQIRGISETTRNMALNFIGLNYKAQGDLDKAFAYSKEAEKYKTDDPHNIILQPYNYGDIYYKKNNIDSALKYGKIAFLNLPFVPGWANEQFASQIACLLGNIYIKLNQKDSAYFYINYALRAAAIHTEDLYFSMNKAVSEIESQLSLAKWFDKWGYKDSCYVAGINAYHQADEEHNFDYMQQCALFLKSVYRKEKKYEEAFKYNDLAIAAKDSLQGVDKVKKTQAMHYDYQLKEQQLADIKNQMALKSSIRLISVGGIFALLFSGLLYRTVIQRKRTIATLHDQNILIESQKSQLHQTIADLHEKQAQLIQAEKMASLGELTAGIAHEIQNPLNFVNNFSEVNVELIEELKNGMANNIDGQGENEIVNNLEANSRKILLHGKRAGNIVRSMLEHSRTRPGEKTDTDINILAEEYLRLSYHAIRAKDNSFSVNLVTQFNPAIPMLKIVPVDMGRALMNIFNNAFYSMNEKKSKSDASYFPSLTIRSQAYDNTVSIVIKDNGPGIPGALLSKIFQPFFTTKPTGNGTGLGLSLSYDIITKAHGGNISVESEEGESCTFIISLPL